MDIEYINSLINDMAEAEAGCKLNFQNEIMKLVIQGERVLWLTRAMRANDRIQILKMRTCYLLDEFNKWKWVERKCRAKAEEFK